MKLTGKFENGREILDVDSWFRFAPPAKGAVQWKDYRSAKELARAWCRYGIPRLPEEVLSILGHTRTRGLRVEQAVAEMEIPFDSFGGPRNADLAFWGNAQKERIVVTVEAKADEEFGKTIEVQRSSGKSNGSNIRTRVDSLLQRVMARELDDSNRSLRYQLFHALIATQELAETKDASLGVLLVHEFVSLDMDFDKYATNSQDLKDFVKTVPGWEEENLKAGKLLRPIKLPGDTIDVTLGKVRTLIPFGSGGRVASIKNPCNQFIALG